MVNNCPECDSISRMRRSSLSALEWTAKSWAENYCFNFDCDHEKEDNAKSND